MKDMFPRITLRLAECVGDEMALIANRVLYLTANPLKTASRGEMQYQTEDLSGIQPRVKSLWSSCTGLYSHRNNLEAGGVGRRRDGLDRGPRVVLDGHVQRVEHRARNLLQSLFFRIWSVVFLVSGFWFRVEGLGFQI